VLYEEKLMQELCAEMGIEWIKEQGWPTIQGQEIINFDDLFEDSYYESNSLLTKPLNGFNFSSEINCYSSSLDLTLAA